MNANNEVVEAAIVPYSYQDGPKRALTSAYTRATDFVLPILSVTRVESFTVKKRQKSRWYSHAHDWHSAHSQRLKLSMPRRKHLDTGRQPSNWPDHIRFLQSSQYHTSVPPAVRQHILVNAGSLRSHGDLNVHIRSITSSSHPACGQLGLFAGQKIPPNCHIIQYLGKHGDLHSLINKKPIFWRWNTLRWTGFGLWPISLPIARKCERWYRCKHDGKSGSFYQRLSRNCEQTKRYLPRGTHIIWWIMHECMEFQPWN